MQELIWEGMQVIMTYKNTTKTFFSMIFKFDPVPFSFPKKSSREV